MGILGKVIEYNVVDAADVVSVMIYDSKDQNGIQINTEKGWFANIV